MALTTVSAIKVHLGIPASDTSQDAQLTQFLAGVTAQIKRYCKRDFEEASYTEFYCGDGTNVLILRQRPVQSIASIYLDAGGNYGESSGAFAAESLLTAGSDYVLKRDNNSAAEKSTSGIVYRIGGVWPGVTQRAAGLLGQGAAAAMGNIKVTYTAGYDSVPADLALAVHNAAALLMGSAANGGKEVQSKSLDYFSVTFAQAQPGDGTPFGSVKQLLSGYRELVF